jgi:GNAT superfamily N-acetyltransferase
MVVHPEHRGRGIGGLMMAWGNEHLDEMGIEGFLEASDLGRALYEKWGYQVVMKLDYFIPPNKGDEWNKWAHELMMPPWYAMWRPPGGVVKPGERNRPWQLVPPLQP